jgi:hypothetical protein
MIESNVASLPPSNKVVNRVGRDCQCFVGKSASLRIHRIRQNIAEMVPRAGTQYDPGQLVAAAEKGHQKWQHGSIVSTLDLLAPGNNPRLFVLTTASPAG